jgi:hypothetical protein
MHSPRRHDHRKQDGRARTYLAECFWPGVTETQLVTAAEHARGTHHATWLELIAIPADEIVLWLYRAAAPVAVADAARHAGFPAERIVESIRIRPDRSPR